MAGSGKPWLSNSEFPLLLCRGAVSQCQSKGMQGAREEGCPGTTRKGVPGSHG